MKEERFPKVKLLTFEFISPLKNIKYKYKFRPMYNRLANAGRLNLPFLGIVLIWRLPYLPHVAFQKGWDSCWRECALNLKPHHRIQRFFSLQLAHLQCSNQIQDPPTFEDEKKIMLSFMGNGCSDNLTVKDIYDFVQEKY